MAKGLTAQSIERLKPNSSKRREVPDGILPGLYLVMQPSGARSWAVRYRYGGKPRKLTLGPYPALELGPARKLAREALEAVQRGRDPALEKQDMRRAAREQDPDRDLVRTVVASFMERYVRANTKPRTADETDRIFRLHVLPVWGKKRIQDVTRRDIVDLLDGIVDAGTPIAANRTLAAVRRMFNWCLDRSIIETSPCLRIKAPTAEQSRDRVLTDDELRLVWRAAEQLGWPFGPFVQLLILTGQRRDEVAKIRRSELSKDGAIWTIPGERTKNGMVHDVPLGRAARRILEGLPRIAGYRLRKDDKPRPRSEADLFFSVTGETAISGYSRAKARLDAEMMKLAQKQAKRRGEDPKKVKLVPWRLHDLRRTTASGMARLGQPVHVVEAVLNHRSGTISGVAAVYNRYSYADEKRTALEAWARFVENLVSDAPASNVVPMRAVE